MQEWAGSDTRQPTYGAGYETQLLQRQQQVGQENDPDGGNKKQYATQLASELVGMACHIVKMRTEGLKINLSVPLFELRLLKGVDDVDKWEAMKIRIPGVYLVNPMLTHDDSCICVMHEVSGQKRNLIKGL